MMFPPSQMEKNEIAKQLLGSELPDGSADTIFKAYFDYYASVVCPSTHGDALVGIDNPALQSHASLLRYIKSLQSNPSLSRDDFLAASLPAGDILPKEKDYVATVATKVAFMIDCSSKDYYSEGFRARQDGLRLVKWEANQPLVDFMEQIFLPDVTQTAAQQEEIGEMLMGKKVLKAWKLIRRYRIKIKPTNNLLEHLLYDPRERTLHVFHHTSFLRAHLKRSKNESLELDFSKSLEL